MSRAIDTDGWSAHYRSKLVDLAGHQLLITRLTGSAQEADLTEPPNCAGFGRIRHFRRTTSPGWPANPLPIDPALCALQLPATDQLRAQVFQLAGCNWRCWYCFVPFDLLSANPRHAAWLSPAALVNLYLDQPDPPPMIDLTGGQPDLVPEWVVWIMTELRARQFERQVYLWSDDNLSNDYFWQFLSDADRELIVTYPLYGRVGCFKGFNAESFAFNTQAEPALFDRQFALMGKLLALGIDLYAYTTFTTPTPAGIRDDMSRFVDRLQALDVNLPLRTVPLEIQVFTPVQARLNNTAQAALTNQWRAIEAWQQELEARYSTEQREQRIVDVPLSHRRLAQSNRSV
jgi:uncharacterized Fe-S cluster-containing radical SAM superfamily protein